MNCLWIILFIYLLYPAASETVVRPGIAGTVLQKGLSFIKWLSHPFPQNLKISDIVKKHISYIIVCWITKWEVTAILKNWMAFAPGALITQKKSQISLKLNINTLQDEFQILINVEIWLCSNTYTNYFRGWSLHVRLNNYKQSRDLVFLWPNMELSCRLWTCCQ